MGVLLARCVVAGESAKPNILFIFSDDHALRTIGAYNPEFDGTPNIDRLAESGAVFTRSYCENSICQPSRAAVLTGKVSHHHGVRTNGSPWNNKQQIFPRLLKQAGYQTAMIGKWHMHPFPSDEFDYHKTLTANGGQGRYYNPAFVAHDGSIVIEKGYSTDIIASESIEWMKNRDKTKPFLMMCQFKAPHTNVMPPLRNLGMYRDGDIPIPETFFDDYEGRNDYVKQSWMKMHGMKSPAVVKITPTYGEYELPKNPTGPERQFKGDYKFLAEMTEAQRNEWHHHYDPQNEDYRKRVASGELTGNKLAEYRYQRYVKDYLRVVAAIDQNVGRLLDWLDASGLAENTIVIYSSDQGFYLGEHGWSDKRLMYEESLGMPFVIRWPGRIKPGQRIDAMIQNIDYAPTFLDIAGLDIPDDIQGKSLVPLFDGKAPRNWRDSIYYHYYHSGAYNLPKIEGVRDDRYKLIRYYDHPCLKLGEQWELFDLKRDPQEMKSEYDNPEYQRVKKKMLRELNKLRKQYGVEE
ncbi:MAG: sulfatase [Kiritimatiellae bacterium]|nr:sulfatase [Kiritimatiellia bacterium]